MTCQQAEPLLARAADGMLDAERGAALALHLDACADCRDALETQRAVREALAARPRAPAPLGFATRVMASLPDTSRRSWARQARREAAAAAGWLEALNWRSWTLRLAPLAGALFVGASLGLGPSTEAAEAGTLEYPDVVTAWLAEETTDGEVRDLGADTVGLLLQDAAETTDDLLIDVLLASNPQGAPPAANEAGR